MTPNRFCTTLDLLIKCIQARLLAIMCTTTARTKAVIAPMPKGPSIDVMIGASAHNIVIDLVAKRYKCAECLSSVSMRGVNQCKAWINSECYSMPKDVRPVLVPYATTQLGKQVAQPSHAMCLHRGLLFCNLCGMRGIVKFHNLAEDCKGPTGRSIHGTRTLEAIRADKVPIVLTCWPNQ